MLYMLGIMKSRICLLVFVLAMVSSYFLIPKAAFSGLYLAVAVAFMIVFSMSAACTARTIRERLKSRKSFLGGIFAVIGLSAIQFCGIAAPACGVSAGLGLLSMILPNVLFHFLAGYSVIVVLVSIAVQIFSLYRMKCFRP